MLAIIIAAVVLVVSILLLFGGAHAKPTPQPAIYGGPPRPLSLSEMRYVRWLAYERLSHHQPDEIHAGVALVAGYVELMGHASFDGIPLIASLSVPDGEVWWRHRGVVVAIQRGLDQFAPACRSEPHSNELWSARRGA